MDSEVLEELESLEAIYGNDYQLITDRSFSITIETTSSRKDVLEITVPINYPNQCPPVIEFKQTVLSNEDIKELIIQLNGMFNTGEVVLFQWIEYIREFITNKMATEEDIKETYTDTNFDTECSSPEIIYSSSSVDDQTDSSIACDINVPSIAHGEPLTDRKSTFQAHVSEIHSIKEVQLVIDRLKENRKIALATHNIVAYRFIDTSKGNNVLVQDCDDDGENAAGSRLLHLLQIMDVCNVLVVVTRWYGGIHLGPDRFKHINNVARVLLQNTGIGKNRDERRVTKSKIKSKKS